LRAMTTLVRRLGYRALVGALLLLGIAACGTEQPVAEDDRALFLRVADLAEFGVRYRDAEAHEKFSKRKHFDGAYELNYEFKTPESEQERPLFIFGSISVQQKTSDAMMSEGAEKIGLLIGFKKEGVEEREVAGAQRFGDSSKFTVLVKDERPIGNVFTVRDGKKTYLLVVAGVFFKDPEAWSRLIGPKLKRLAAYSPA
jgi:hypothetical protein